MRSAYVGEQAQNVVPEKAVASLEARLVKGEDPKEKFEQIAAFIAKQGSSWWIANRHGGATRPRANCEVVYEGGLSAYAHADGFAGVEAVGGSCESGTGTTQ